MRYSAMLVAAMALVGCQTHPSGMTIGDMLKSRNLTPATLVPSDARVVYPFVARDVGPAKLSAATFRGSSHTTFECPSPCVGLSGYGQNWFSLYVLTEQSPAALLQQHMTDLAQGNPRAVETKEGRTQNGTKVSALVNNTVRPAMAIGFAEYKGHIYLVRMARTDTIGHNDVFNVFNDIALLAQ